MAWKPFDFFKYDLEKDGNQTFNINKALNENWDHTEELIEEVREKIQSAEGDFKNYQKKAERLSYTMAADGWDQESKTYSFEETYPNAQYDIQIEPAKGYTEEQSEAWGAALIKGDLTLNVATADGEVPAVDLPIYMEVTKK